MPELPEVETVRRTLELALINEQIDHVKLLYANIVKHDLNDFVNKLKNQVIHRIDRKGKYLIFILDQHVLVMHLRMEGKFYIKKGEPILKHEHIIYYFKSGKELRYHDVRKFGTTHLLSINDYLNQYPLSEVGSEPEALDINDFFNQLQLRKSPIKSALLDQHLIAGLGNIYVDETLFLAKIHPTRPSNSINYQEALDLKQSATNVLKKAVELGGTTIRSYTSSLGVHGRFQNELNVHMQKGKLCPVCQTEIIKMKVGGRGTYVCPKCQK